MKDEVVTRKADIHKMTARNDPFHRSFIPDFMNYLQMDLQIHTTFPNGGLSSCWNRCEMDFVLGIFKKLIVKKIEELNINKTTYLSGRTSFFQS